MKPEELQCFNPREEIVFTANRLPHWQQKGRMYFVTFRLADSVPKHLIERRAGERERWLEAHPTPWSRVEEREYLERFVGAMEVWLDARHGACVLRQPARATVVDSALRYFDGKRYDLCAFVIMPNHVHVLFRLHEGHTLEQVLFSWKRFAARRINLALGSSGHLWQRDYFDRLVRNEDHLRRCVRYIRNNPERANLRAGEYRSYEGSLARAIV